MLEAVSKAWFSWNYTITEDSRPVAEVDLSWWREEGFLTVEGMRYHIYREKMLSGAFILEAAGMKLARAEKPSAFQRAFIIEYAGKQYTLRAKSAFSRAFVFLDDSGEIGWIAPRGFFTRVAEVNLPEYLPLPVKVFIIWLVILLWKRESDSASVTESS
jgi:hypothetical protein